MPRLPGHARTIPFCEECFLGATSFPPADAVPHRRVARRHRLTVHADLLPQVPGDPCLGVGELDALGANPAVLTHDPALPIHQRRVMRGPRLSQIGEQPVFHCPHVRTRLDHHDGRHELLLSNI